MKKYIYRFGLPCLILGAFYWIDLTFFGGLIPGFLYLTAGIITSEILKFENKKYYYRQGLVILFLYIIFFIDRIFFGHIIPWWSLLLIAIFFSFLYKMVNKGMIQTIKIFFVFLWLKIQELIKVVCKTTLCVIAGILIVSALATSFGAVILGVVYFFSPSIIEEFIQTVGSSMDLIQGWFYACLIVGGSFLVGIGILTILYLSAKESWRRYL